VSVLSDNNNDAIDSGGVRYVSIKSGLYPTCSVHALRQCFIIQLASHSDGILKFLIDTAAEYG